MVDSDFDWPERMPEGFFIESLDRYLRETVVGHILVYDEFGDHWVWRSLPATRQGFHCLGTAYTALREHVLRERSEAIKEAYRKELDRRGVGMVRPEKFVLGDQPQSLEAEPATCPEVPDDSPERAERPWNNIVNPHLLADPMPYGVTQEFLNWLAERQDGILADQERLWQSLRSKGQRLGALEGIREPTQ